MTDENCRTCDTRAHRNPGLWLARAPETQMLSEHQWPHVVALYPPPSLRPRPMAGLGWRGGGGAEHGWPWLQMANFRYTQSSIRDGPIIIQYSLYSQHFYMVHTVCNSGSKSRHPAKYCKWSKNPGNGVRDPGNQKHFFLTFVYLIFLLWLFKRGVLQPLCDKLAYLKKYCFMKKVLND